MQPTDAKDFKGNARNSKDLIYRATFPQLSLQKICQRKASAPPWGRALCAVHLVPSARTSPADAIFLVVVRESKHLAVKLPVASNFDQRCSNAQRSLSLLSCFIRRSFPSRFAIVSRVGPNTTQKMSQTPGNHFEDIVHGLCTNPTFGHNHDRDSYGGKVWALSRGGGSFRHPNVHGYPRTCWGVPHYIKHIPRG